MGLAIFSGCTSTGSGSGGDTVSKDDPWYEVAAVDVGAYEGSFATDVNVVYADDTELLFTKYDIWNSEGEEGAHELFSCDYSGNVTTVFDLSEAAESTGIYYADQVFKLGDDIYIFGVTMESEGKIIRVDAETGEAEEVKNDAVDKILSATDFINSYSEFKCFGDTLYISVKTYDDDTFVETVSAIYMIDSDWNLTEVDLSEVDDHFGKASDVSHYISESGKVLFYQVDWGEDVELKDPVILNIADGSLTALAEDSVYDEFNLAWSGDTKIEDGVVYRYDIDTDTSSEYFNLNWANVNRRYIERMSLYYADDEKLVFAEDGSQIRGSDISKIYMLQKAEENPNAGKTVLTVASINGDTPDADISEAIVKFNNESEDTFVQIDYKYGYSEDYDGDYTQYLLDNDANICDVLTLDIKSGDAPDVILSGGNKISMNNDTLFVDLKEYIDGNNGINMDDFFSGVFESAEVDGCLYHAPVSVDLNAIAADRDMTEDDVSGMTYEEYEEFLGDELNGINILSVNDDRMSVFLALFEEMGDTFISDGNITIDNDEFRTLADFCKEYVDEESYWSRVEDEDYEAAESQVSQCHATASASMYLSLSEFLQYSGNWKAEEMALIANPTTDGRMPSVSLDNTMGITQCCDDADKAWAFVKFVLENYTATDSQDAPVRSSAYDEFAERIIADTKEDIGFDMEVGISSSDAGLTTANTNVYREALENAAAARMSDSATEKILKEEMPSYFAGQKSIDEVISVVTKRVQTIYDERN